MPLPLSVCGVWTPSELPQPALWARILFLEFLFNFRWLVHLFIRQKCTLPECLLDKKCLSDDLPLLPLGSLLDSTQAALTFSHYINAHLYWLVHLKHHHAGCKQLLRVPLVHSSLSLVAPL